MSGREQKEIRSVESQKYSYDLSIIREYSRLPSEYPENDC